MMAHQSYNYGSSPCNPWALRLALFFMAFCLVCYTMGLPLYWRFLGNSAAHGSCPPCLCDCSSEPMISIPLSINIEGDCGKRDPEMNEEMEKSIADLLAEELRLLKNVADEKQHHADVSLLEAKKLSSQYQKEAEKCNAGMETCEEAREKAEAALIAERNWSAVWEERARRLGWRDSRRRTASS